MWLLISVLVYMFALVVHRSFTCVRNDEINFVDGGPPHAT